MPDVTKLERKYRATFPKPLLDFYAKHAKGEKEGAHRWRFHSLNELAKLDFDGGWVKGSPEAPFVTSLGGVLPILTNDNSDLLVLHCDGPLDGRLSLMLHDDSSIALAFSSLDSFLKARKAGAFEDGDLDGFDYVADEPRKADSKTTKADAEAAKLLQKALAKSDYADDAADYVERNVLLLSRKKPKKPPTEKSKKVPDWAWHHPKKSGPNPRVEEAARAGKLEDLAWESITDPDIIAAIDAAWRVDPKMAKTLTLLDQVRNDEGRWDAESVKTLAREGDRRVTPILIARVANDDDENKVNGLIALNVLAEWDDPRVRERLRGVNMTLSQWEPFMRLLLTLGDPANAPALLSTVDEGLPLTENNARDFMDNMGLRQLSLAIFILGELGVEDANERLAPFVKSNVDERDSSCPLGLREAIFTMFAAVGGQHELDLALQEFKADKRALFGRMELLFAIGQLAARVGSASTKSKVLELFAKGRVTTSETPIDELVDGGSPKHVACYLAIEEAFALLAPDPKQRREARGNVIALIEGILGQFGGELVDGYDGQALIVWTLVALRRYPESKLAAKPWLESDHPLERALARIALR